MWLGVIISIFLFSVEQVWYGCEHDVSVSVFLQQVDDKGDPFGQFEMDIKSGYGKSGQVIINLKIG